MHRKILLVTSGLLYYALASFALFMFESDLLVTSIILFGVPAYLLARYSAAPSAVLAAVVVFGAGIAVLLEGVAHIYGIWYTLGVDELRLFGLIPVEILFSLIVQTLFLALLYELVFDDGQYTVSSARDRLTAFGVFTLCVLSLIGIHQYLLRDIFFTHSYAWILGILVVSSLATVAVHQKLSLRLLQRLVSFTAVAAVPLLIALALAVVNTHKVFAHVQDYLFTFTLYGNTVPIEEVLLTLAMPLFVAVFYEVYLDDAR